MESVFDAVKQYGLIFLSAFVLSFVIVIMTAIGLISYCSRRLGLR